MYCTYCILRVSRRAILISLHSSHTNISTILNYIFHSISKSLIFSKLYIYKNTIRHDSLTSISIFAHKRYIKDKIHYVSHTMTDSPEQLHSTQAALPPLFLYQCTLSRGYTGFFLNLSLAGCTIHKDCPLTEACIEGICQEPCLVWNPCAQNAICVNTNHRADCSCEDGYHGNGFNYCEPGILIFHYGYSYLLISFLQLISIYPCIHYKYLSN